MNSYHTPVLLNEVIESLHIAKGKRYIDATLGGGGHSVEILRRGGTLLSIDADHDALSYAKDRVKGELPEIAIGRDWIVAQGNFRDIDGIAKSKGFDAVDGILFDLGVSSKQLDSEVKGFTYRVGSGRLDMRFDQSIGWSAAEILAQASEDDLYEIFTKFGEEERARAIAHALIRARSVRSLENVADVVSVIDRIVTNKNDRFAVLSRIFQAIRMAVNDELEALKSGLEGAETLLRQGGIISVISFHSLEDRTVKLFFLKARFDVLTKKPITATAEEIYRNGRSRSAKLRVAKRI